MPDGSIARCYAQDVAEGVARAAYAHGFEHHYWNPSRLIEPSLVKEPSRIFLDSMSDIMGAWVPVEDIEQVLQVVQSCYWHDFQLLTKNPKRLLKFANQLPENLWIGVSMPPSHMNGRALVYNQQARYMGNVMDVFHKLTHEGNKPNVLWMSLEPLSFDVAPHIRFDLIDWLVIGAASNGQKKYQPDAGYVRNVLDLANEHHVPVFFKGNLDWQPRREEMPWLHLMLDKTKSAGPDNWQADQFI